MLAGPSVAVVPSDRRASAIRRFPPGCGRRRRRHHNDAATRLPHADPLPITSAAAAKPPLPNPSVARAADKAAPPRPRRATPAAASYGLEEPRRVGVGSGRKAPAAAAVNVRSVSAVRRYPPGCGRGVAVSKRKAPVGESGAGEPTEMVGNGETKAGDLAQFNSNGVVLSTGDAGTAGAQEKPWVVNGLMAVPFMPWAQHGRRKSQPNA
nr:unnamed protein product [Digitaria exilis]